MDRGHKLQVNKSMEEWEKTATKIKDKCEDFKLGLQIQRSNADISKSRGQQRIHNYINTERTTMDGKWNIAHGSVDFKMEVAVTSLLKQMSQKQRESFEKQINEERSVLNLALTETEAQCDSIIKSERRQVDKIINQLWEQMDKALENERSKYNTLIEYLNGAEDEDAYYIPRRHLFILLRNECAPEVVMRFKVHLVLEIYSDLKKYYDKREELGEFTITTPATSVDYCEFMNCVRRAGYIGHANLYYLNPAPGSEPSSDLIEIFSPEDVKSMVRAHAQERTKICHLYIEGPEFDDYNDETYNQTGGSFEYDVEENGGVKSPARKKPCSLDDII